ncbi:MAG: MarR family transcriptional regulator [Actinobacteria bacterium]|nr:MarR family transcriptional regulator [Actinomycetota bacterium]
MTTEESLFTRDQLEGTPALPDLACRLRLAVTRLSRRLRQQVSLEITPSQQSALTTVEEQGSVTLGDLAAAERVQPPSMSRVVANLEDAGLVERHIDPVDRRVVRVSLTPKGRLTLKKSRSLRTAYLACRLATLSEEETELIARAVVILEHLLEEDERG